MKYAIITRNGYVLDGLFIRTFPDVESVIRYLKTEHPPTKGRHKPQIVPLPQRGSKRCPENAR